MIFAVTHKDLEGVRRSPFLQIKRDFSSKKGMASFYLDVSKTATSSASQYKNYSVEGFTLYIVVMYELLR